MHHTLQDTRYMLFFAPFCKGIETVCELFVPYIMALIIDVGIKNNDVSYIIWFGVLMLALNLIGIIFSLMAQKFGAIAQPESAET